VKPAAVTPEVVKELAVVNGEAQEYLEVFQTFHITTQGEMSLASELRAELKGKIKNLEERRKTVTVPLNQALKAVNDLFRAPLDTLNTAVVILNSRITEARAEMDRIAQEAIAALSEAAAQSDSEAIQEAIVAHDNAVSATTATGLGFRKRWTFRVVDESQIPREFMIPDVKALQAFATSLKDGAAVPGVEFYAEEIVSGR
jgi:hypothetical protein